MLTALTANGTKRWLRDRIAAGAGLIFVDRVSQKRSLDAVGVRAAAASGVVMPGVAPQAPRSL
ncbi:MAG TPA: hypothetical protein VGN17_28045 [Bryobacteraceae bacterium]